MIFRVIASACWFRLKCLRSSFDRQDKMFYARKHTCSFPPGIDLFVRLDVVKSSIEFDKSRLAVSVKAIFANGLHFILSSLPEAELFIVHEVWLWCVRLSITSMGGARMHCLLLSCVAMISDAVTKRVQYNCPMCDAGVMYARK